MKSSPAPKKNYNNSNSNNNSRKKTFSKDKKVEVAPKNEVKEMFFSWFKKHRNVGQIMTKTDVVTNVIKKLDSKQNSVLEEAMNELKNNGFIEVKEDGVTLVLTQRGYDFIS